MASELFAFFCKDKSFDLLSAPVYFGCDDVTRPSPRFPLQYLPQHNLRPKIHLQSYETVRTVQLLQNYEGC